MQSRTCFYIFLLLTYYSSLSYAQINYDSIYNRVDTLNGVEKIDLLNQLSIDLAFKDLDFSKELADKSLALSDSLSYKKGRIFSFYSLSFLQYLKGDLQESIKFGTQAVENIDESISYSVRRDIYIQLAKSHEETYAYDKSLMYFQLAYDLCNKNKDNSGIGLAQLGIGLLYLKMKNYEMAMDHIQSSYYLFESVDNLSGMAKSSIEMARCFMLLNQSDSVSYYLTISEKFHAGDIQKFDLYTVKVTFYQDVSLDSAIYYQNQLIELASNTGRTYEMENLLMKLSELYADAGDFERAALEFSRFENWRDSLKMGGSQKNQIKVQDRIRIAKSDQDAIINPEATNTGFFAEQKTYYYVLIGGGVLILVIIFWLYGRYRFQKKSIIKLNRLENDIFSLTEELKKKDDQLLVLKENEVVVKKQVATLRKLFSEDEGIYKPQDQIQEISRKLAANINADIIGIWIFKSESNSIECFDEYNQQKDIHRSGEIIHLDNFPLYKEALINSTYLDAGTARNDPRTMEFNESRLIPKNIYAKLDIPLLLNNSLKGIIWIESLSKKESWAKADIEFVLSISELISQIVFNKILKISKEKVIIAGSSKIYEGFIEGLNNARKNFYGIRDINGSIKLIIGNSSDLMGYTGEELQGINWYELLADTLKDYASDFYQRINEGKETDYNWVMELCDKAGNTGTFVETIISINDAGKQQLVFFEIRALENWTSDLSKTLENNKLLESIFNSINVPVFVLNHKTVVVGYNKAFKNLINKKDEEIQWVELFTLLKDSSDDFISEIVKIRDSDFRSSIYSDESNVFKNSVDTVGEWHISKFESKDDVYIFGQFLSKKIIERPEENIDFDNLYDILGLKKKKYFKSVNMIFILDLLQRHAELMKRIKLPVEFNHIENVPPENADYSLTQFFSQLEILIDTKSRNRVVFHYEKSLINFKVSYPFLFTICILEMVENALKSIKDSGDIYIALSEENDLLDIRVTDTGEGMSSEVKLKAFLPFYSRFAKGNGIGLSAVKEILRYINASLKITSHLGKGTELKILWPKD